MYNAGPHGAARSGHDAAESKRTDMTTFFKQWFDGVPPHEATASLQAQVLELQATVATLLKMLADAEQVDTKVLRYRVEAALEDRRAPALEDVPSEMPAEIRCAKCGRMRPPQHTVMTARGAECDTPCLATSPSA
jgi:hypothetical protein